MAQQEATLRKRQQISQSNRVMFVWVAAAAAIVGLSLVISWFLFQQIEYRLRVVNKKNDTVTTLKANNKAAPALRDNIRVLETNEDLQAAKAHAEEKALQVILDALPAEDNPLALGASLQTRLIGEQSNIQLETLSVDPDMSSSQVKSATSTEGAAKPMPFRFSVSTPDINSLNELIQRLERSVRIIDIDTIKIESNDSRTVMDVQAHAFYLPERTVELKTITVPTKAKAKK